MTLWAQGRVLRCGVVSPPDRRVPPPPPPGAPGHEVPSGWDAPEPAPRNDRRDLPKAPGQYHVPADAGAPAGTPPRVSPSAPEFPGGPRPPGQAPPRPVPGPAPRRQRRKVRPRRVVAWVAGGLLAFLVVFVVFGLWQYQRMERVQVASVLSSGGSGTNYLIVGSDTRRGFDPNDPNSAAVIGDGTAADPTERSDTMVVLRVADDGARMLSIPRDLWVTRPDGSQGRINATYQQGPAALIQTVQSLGIPVHHYLEVDFVTFAGMVDAVGGVTLEFAHPAQDPGSGLDIPHAGPVTLDGTQALAYVRARRYTELVDGSWRADPTGDLGRGLRQQQFLRAVMGEVGSTRNPIELMRVSGALADGLRVDDNLGLFDALGLARRMRGLDPESVELPVYGYRTSGGASVLGLSQPQAEEVLARFR